VAEQTPKFPQWQFAFARPPLSRAAGLERVGANIWQVSYYPLAECWNAFDGAISAAGYNSVAELLHYGIPTIWVPLQRQVDEQKRRAERIVQQQAGWMVAPYDTPGLLHALDTLGNPQVRSRLSATARASVPTNGAERAADYLLQWLNL
jgi:UDP-N-acetylglucosamine--N-acetylmuramyl-(pentapeptide) pyrophosphoryl-undecaprenol N-acetylglucosamine transferase